MVMDTVAVDESPLPTTWYTRLSEVAVVPDVGVYRTWLFTTDAVPRVGAEVMVTVPEAYSAGSLARTLMSTAEVRDAVAVSSAARGSAGMVMVRVAVAVTEPFVTR
jgi:hypothetical protein